MLATAILVSTAPSLSNNQTPLSPNPPSNATVGTTNPPPSSVTVVNETESKNSSKLYGMFALAISVGAATLAYTANKRSKVHNPVLMAIVAILFSEIYLVQAGVRYATGDYIIKQASA